MPATLTPQPPAGFTRSSHGLLLPAMRASMDDVTQPLHLGTPGGDQAAAGVIPLDYPQEWPPGSGIRGPNTRQKVAHAFAPHVDELLYGGARGGGKTDFLLAEGIRRAIMIPGHNGVIFRNTYKQLAGRGGIMPRLLMRLPRNVARWNKSEKLWTFYNGSSLNLSYLDKPEDVQAWLGLELQWMGFDQVEALDEETYVNVRTSLRVTGELAQLMTELGLRPSSAATANPGGPGHVWVKRRFVDSFPAGDQAFRVAPSEDEPTPSVRCFVQALLRDNPALDLGDPSYRAKIEGLKDPELRKAWLEGDWNVLKGARFSAFRTSIHVRKHSSIEMPAVGTAARATGIDYGQTQPFVCLWGVRLMDDLVWVYREISAPGLSAFEQAARILAAERPGERSAQFPIPNALDPSCWTPSADKPLPRTGGKVVRTSGPPKGSIAWHYAQAGLHVTRADNRRNEGAADVAARLVVRPDGFPRLLIAETCTNLVATLPALQRRKTDPEDVEKGPTDHWYDALRYLLGMLGFMSAPPPPPPPGGTSLVTRRPDPEVVGVVTPGGLVIPPGPSTRSLRRRGF